MASEFEEKVVERLKWCIHGKHHPAVLIREVTDCMTGLSTPSTHLCEILVSHLCFSNNHPTLWKFIDHCLSTRLISPLHLLSLLASRVIPHRHSEPEAFRLFLDLLNRYAFSFDLHLPHLLESRVTKAVDTTLQLSTTYGVEILGFGHALVLGLFSIIFRLIDSITEDCQSSPLVDADGAYNGKQLPLQEGGRRKQIGRSNSLTALEVLAGLTGCRKGMALFRLVGLNMPDRMSELLNRCQYLQMQKVASSSPSDQAHHRAMTAKLQSNIQKALQLRYRFRNIQLNRMLIDIDSPPKMQSCCSTDAGISGSWVAFDIYMENLMDGQQFHVTSAVDILKETIITLNVYNQASWQETFLALWLSALRLVQRERDPLEGPIPHLEARLCVLLSVVPLAICQVLEEEDVAEELAHGHPTNIGSHCSRKQQLIYSLQVLGQFGGLLCPPASVLDAAQMASGRAGEFISNSRNLNDGSGQRSFADASVKADGDMRHLIVEACIARNLLDTSAFFWPGYATSAVTFVPDTNQNSWKTFMEGAPLTEMLVDALVSTPASSIAEVEKLYHMALNGSEEEKPAAAKILCGASLRRGWNIQQHVVRSVVRLLSPPPPPNFSEEESHLVAFTPMLNAVLRGASSIDTVHILSLHGVVPEVAASLLPVCEVFGSLLPTLSHKSNIGDEPSIYMVFSSAFLFLLRLWKFYKPPLSDGIRCGGAFGSELTLEYLLLVYNARTASRDSSYLNGSNNLASAASQQDIYIDSYPKLKAWYCLNKSCIASTLSGISTGNPIHQVADKILKMVYWKKRHVDVTLAADSSTPSSTGGSSSAAAEESCETPLLPAWEVLEATPLVLESMLTACAHGRLSSRDLTTGLRDLVDFLPASLASIISYFSAEVTRGLWKPVSMNGTDWPSPAANLASINAEMKEILATAGVEFPRCLLGDFPATLPLPMAALLSLTITFKLEKSIEYIHAVAGPALENCASGCPWPSMPIVGSLWAQKVRRWHNFIVVSSSRSVFRQNVEAVAQLLGNCFSSFLGSSVLPSMVTMTSLGSGGISGLLGHSVSCRSHCPPVAPGFLYLRSCRTIQNVQVVNDVVVKLVAEYACSLAPQSSGHSSRVKSASQPSLAFTIAKAKQVASLGASFLFVAGGFQRVHDLYAETIPTWLLSSKRASENSNRSNSMSRVMEGFTLAYMLVLSGSLVWTVGGAKHTSWAMSRRGRVLEDHLKFVARALEGNISPGCDPVTWKAYVSSLVYLIVRFSSAWIQEVEVNTLKKLADGLGGWHEYELAIALLERGGPGAITSVIGLFDMI